MSGNLLQAIESYEKVLEIDQENEIACSNKASLLIETSQYDKALNMCDMKLENNPKYDVGLYLKGSIYFRLGDLDNVKKFLKKLIDTNPKSLYTKIIKNCQNFDFS